MPNSSFCNICMIIESDYSLCKAILKLCNLSIIVIISPKMVIKNSYGDGSESASTLIISHTVKNILTNFWEKLEE